MSQDRRFLGCQHSALFRLMACDGYVAQLPAPSVTENQAGSMEIGAWTFAIFCKRILQHNMESLFQKSCQE